MKKAVYIIGFLLSCMGVHAQGEAKENHHKIGVALTHVNISSGIDGSGNKWLTLPGFSLDYDYRICEKWSLGLHTDIIIEKFAVEENLSSEGKTLERSYPIAPAIMGSRRFGHHTVMFGAGAEFAKEENLFLNRIGYEYGIEIGEKWEVAAGLNYDFRWNAYDSYILGIVIGRSF
ncbi:hypothetical protein ACLI1A_14995 [Flavobacterium sp. RHBU_3]|uniref:hypothetical protein n=1 Tax=Flavobacterium sp. RHBU_3 TaxID=3391184 RepID=UPI003984EDDB